MNEKQNQDDNKPPSGIINKLKKYFYAYFNEIQNNLV